MLNRTKWTNGALLRRVVTDCGRALTRSVIYWEFGGPTDNCGTGSPAQGAQIYRWWTVMNCWLDGAAQRVQAWATRPVQSRCRIDSVVGADIVVV